MNKNIKIVLLSIFMFFFISILLGCNTKPEEPVIEEKTITSISVSNDSVLEFDNSVDVTKIYLNINYSDNTTKKISVTTEMLSLKDIESLKTDGEHKVMINYLAHSIELSIKVNIEEVIVEPKIEDYYTEETEVVFYLTKKNENNEVVLKVMSLDGCASFNFRLTGMKDALVEKVDETNECLQFSLQDDILHVTYVNSANINEVIELLKITLLSSETEIDFTNVFAYVIIENKVVSIEISNIKTICEE